MSTRPRRLEGPAFLAAWVCRGRAPTTFTEIGLGEGNMDDAKIRAAVIAEWAKVYPEDQQPIVVTVVIDKAFGGALTAIRSKEADGTPNEE